MNLLSTSTTASLAVIKEFVVRKLGKQNKRILEDQASIRKCKQDTVKMRKEIDGLMRGAKVFQQNKCSLCKQALDLPSVHFLCMHSFHQRCLYDNEHECPTCGPKTSQIKEIKKSLQDNVNDHEGFFRQLKRSEEGFSVIAEYFGRDLFSKREPNQ